MMKRYRVSRCWTRFLLAMMLLWFGTHGCSRCERPGTLEPQTTQSSMGVDVESEMGDEVGATDAIETPQDPKWESALEPGIGE